MLLLSVLCIAAIKTEPPAEWLAEIARSNYLYSPNDALIKDNLKATIGNGQLATQIDSNALYIAGVYNGPAAKPFSDRASAAADDVSHRATVTSPLNVQCAESMTALFKPAGAALDLRGARYLRRSTAADGSGGVLEQRFFAHRTERGLLVLELANVGSAPITCMAAFMALISVTAWLACSASLAFESFSTAPSDSVTSLGTSCATGVGAPASASGVDCKRIASTKATTRPP